MNTHVCTFHDLGVYCMYEYMYCDLQNNGQSLLGFQRFSRSKLVQNSLKAVKPLSIVLHSAVCTFHDLGVLYV
jgi:hypothetical protein